MIVLSAVLKPKVGSVRDVQALAEEYVDFRGGMGAHIVATRTVWGASGQQFGLTSFHDNLGEVEESMKAVAETDEFKRLATAVAPHLEVPVGWNIHERLVAPATQGGAKFGLHVSLQPKPGSVMAVRDASIDWVNNLNASGDRCALLVRMLHADGPVFRQRLPFDSLADAEEMRNRLGDSDELRAFGEKVTPHLMTLPSWGLNEVIATAGV